MKLSNPLIIIIAFTFFVISACGTETYSDENKDNEEPEEQEEVVTTETNNNYMVYKMYKIKTKGLFSEPRGKEITAAFNKIYEENEILMVGAWANADDENEAYYITGYHDQGHYDDFVEKMKTHEEYQAMSAELEEDRVSIEVVDLKTLVN